MEDLQSGTLRLIIALLFISLPIVSAVLIGPRHGIRWPIAYVRCLIAYIIAFALITLGFLFENSLEWIPQINQYWGGWRIPLEIVKFAPSALYWEEIAICSCLIQFVVLLKDQPKEIAVAGLRAAFLSLSFADILVGMVIGYRMPDYIINVFCNLVGAIVFGIVNAVLIVRLFPHNELLPAVARGS